MADAFSVAFSILKALNPSPHHMDEGLDEEQMRHFGNMQGMKQRFSGSPSFPHSRETLPPQPEPVDRTNPRGIIDTRMIQPPPTRQEKPIEKAWRGLKAESLDEMELKHKNEREALLQQHSNETGVPNLWFDPRILSDPQFERQNQERLKMMLIHNQESKEPTED